MDLSDLFFDADVEDPLHRPVVQIYKASRIDDLEPAVFPGYLSEDFLVQRKIARFIRTEIKVIVTESTAAPLAARAAQQHNLTPVFFGDLRISGQRGIFHLSISPFLVCIKKGICRPANSHQNKRSTKLRILQ